MSENYGVNSITKPPKVEVMRKKYGMYIGNNGLTGYHHLVYEILSNSIDECINGHGDKIIVRHIDKNTIEIEDFGRGIPFGKNKNGDEVLFMIFSELHAGGKMDNTNGQSGYKFSGGTNGVGTSVVNFLSKEMEIESIRDGKIATLKFIDGESTEKTIIKKYSGEKLRGTRIRFTPELSIFNGIKGFDEEYIKNMIKNQVYLQKINIIFENIHGNIIEFKNDIGISKFLEEKNSEYIQELTNDDTEVTETDNLIKNITPITSLFIGNDLEYVNDKDNEKFLFDYSFELIQENKGELKGFTNSIYNPEGGTHVIGFQKGIYKGIKSILQKGNIKDIALGKDLIPMDVYNIIVGIISVKIANPIFEGQTKNKLTNDFIQKLIEEKLPIEIEKNISQEDLEKIKKILRIKVDNRLKLQKQIIEFDKLLTEKEINKKLKTKLVEASSKDRSETELFIVEGDSAGGNLKAERNIRTQAIMPLKGKIINCFNSKKESILQNQEVNNLIYGISGGFVGDEFDIEKHFRYGKIILLADQDDDGLHIVLLILSFFLKFYPKLIEEGKIFIGVSPLYALKKKEDIKYFYTERAKDNFLNSKEGKNYDVSRFKGLGEMDSSMLYEFTMNIKNRKIQKITTKDLFQDIDWFQNLMGDNSIHKFNVFKEGIKELLYRIDNDQLGLEDPEKSIKQIGIDNSILYSIKVNKERATPSIEDGLKIVHRRSIYALKKDLKSSFQEKKFYKSAKLVGTVIGDYHPHGDTSVYNAVVGLIQDFSNNIPLIKGRGNFGSIYDVSGFAAMRYTEVLIEDITEKYLTSFLNKDSVDFIPNYSNEKSEPKVLPAVLPFCLINDNEGVGYGKGMTNSIPSHNIIELLHAMIGYLKTPQTGIKKYNASDYIFGPDFSVGNILMNSQEEIKKIYESPTGGNFRIRVPIEIDTHEGKTVLVIKQVPHRSFQVDKLLNSLNDLIEEKKLLGIKSFEDKTGRDDIENSLIKEKKGKKGKVDEPQNSKGFKILLYVDNSIDINIIIEGLYATSELNLEKNIPYRPLFVNRFEDLKSYSLNEIITEFLNFRKETIIRIKKFDLNVLDQDIKNLYCKYIHALHYKEITKIIESNFDKTSGVDESAVKGIIIENYSNQELKLSNDISLSLEITNDMAQDIIDTGIKNIGNIFVIQKKLISKISEKAEGEKFISSDTKIKNFMIKEYEDILNEMLTSSLYGEKYNNFKRKTILLNENEVLALQEKKNEFNNYIKDQKKQSNVFYNIITIDQNNFLEKTKYASELNVLKRYEEIKGNNEYKHIFINTNTQKIYTFSYEKGYFINIDKIKEKKPININLLINNIKGNPLYFMIDENFEKEDETLIICYKDIKGNIGALKILKSDFLKKKNGYDLSKNEIIHIQKETIDTFDFKTINNIKDIFSLIDDKKYEKKSVISINDIPMKKSSSSGKIFLIKK